MAESEYTQQDVAFIRTHVEQLQKMVAYEMASNPRCEHRARRGFETRPGMPEIYIQLRNGPLTQQQLIQTTGLDKSKVSRVCQALVDEGFVEVVALSVNKGKPAYVWSAFERPLQLSRIADEILKAKARDGVQRRSQQGRASSAGLEDEVERADDRPADDRKRNNEPPPPEPRGEDEASDGR